jgi:hypothetical protein
MTNSALDRNEGKPILEPSREVENWVLELAPWANGRFRRGTSSPDQFVLSGVVGRASGMPKSNGEPA